MTGKPSRLLLLADTTGTGWGQARAAAAHLGSRANRPVRSRVDAASPSEVHP